MTDQGHVSPVARHMALRRIWDTPPGWGRFTAVNHTVIGRRFMVTAGVFFVIGGLLAMLIRVQLATPGGAFVDAGTYGQLFTMHGTVMMFLFAIPMLEGWAMYLLPKMLGARDLAFPRLSAYGYWCYLFGGSILIAALLAGAAPDGGWFMYTPLTSKPFSPGINADVWLIGVTFVEISAVAAAVEITVSILMLRAPGMSLGRMPVFAWAMLVTAAMMVFGFPPLILGSILLEVERAFDWPFFDPTRGGDPLLWQHLFWLFGHPEVYIIFIPATGLISTMIPVLAGHPLIGYRMVVASLAALGFISFGLWAHHMFTVGIPRLAIAFFSGASLAVAIPTGVQIFAWIGTLALGRPRMTLPMLHLMGFFFVFVAGGLTGVMLAVVPFDWQAHDSHFVVAHLHYVLIGGFVFPILAATTYYLPLVTGRETVFGLGRLAFWLIFLGMNGTFLLMHLTGLRGMPRRVAGYEEAVGWTGLNLISSVGGFVMTMGFALFALDLLLQRRYGPRTARNPWRAETLEWAVPVPPPSYAFAALPTVTSRAPLTDDPGLGVKLAAGKGYLATARNGWQETLAVTVASGTPAHIVILPRRSVWPLVSAAATGSVALALLFKLYPLAILAAAVLVATLFAWAPGSGSDRDRGALPAGGGLALPTHPEVPWPPSRLGMVVLLAADATFAASLGFGLIYLWAVAPGWPPPVAAFDPTALAVVAVGAAVAAVANRLAVGRTKAAAPATPWVAVAALAQGAAAVGGAVVGMASLPDPSLHAAAATSAAVLAYAVFHAGVGALLGLFGLWRIRTGHVGPRRVTDLAIAGHWHVYTAATAALFTGLVAVMDGLAG